MVSHAHACLSVRYVSKQHRRPPGSVHLRVHPWPCPHYLLLWGTPSGSARPWEGEQSRFVSSSLPQDFVHTDRSCSHGSVLLRCWCSGLREQAISTRMMERPADGILPETRQWRDGPACVCTSAIGHTLLPQKTSCSPRLQAGRCLIWTRSLSDRRQPERFPLPYQADIMADLQT